MAKSAGCGVDEGASAPEGLPQHPLVDQLKPDPSQPARRFIVLTGLPGNSDRPGYQRLYLTTKLDYYAEFPASDMVHAEAVPADQSQFAGHEATRVRIGRDATIHYIWARSPQPVDEFDLDVRLGAAGAASPALPIRTGVTCFPDGTACGTCDGTCDDTCPHTCQTCHGTCRTCPGQATCHTCPGQATCAGQTCVFTQCNQNTCQTCQTQCNQATCNTCRTQCGQVTCDDTCHRTCITCIHPHCPPPM